MELKPRYKQTEVGVIPEDWEVSTVGREFDIQLGKMLDSGKNVGVLKPYLGNKSVQWGRVETAQLPFMRFSPLDLPRFRLKRGDLLVCEGGEVGRAALWEDQLPECYYQKALHRLRSRNGFNSRLMIDLLRLWTAQDKLSDYVTQTSIAHLTKEKFAQIWLPIPPEQEQRAIATALSDVDALIAKLDQLIAKKRDLKQAAMQQLLTGKTRLPGFSGEWEVKRLDHAGHCMRGVSYRGDSDLSAHDTADTIRLLRANNVQNSAIHFDDVQYVNSARVSARQILKCGDILICMANGSKALVGKAGFFHVGDGYQYTFGAFMGCFRSNAELADSYFLFSLLHTAQYRDYINSLLVGSSINNLTPSSIESLEFSFPSYGEQAAIATVLSDMDAEIASLEARREKTHAIKQSMMQVLLTGQVRLPVSTEPMEALA